MLIFYDATKWLNGINLNFKILPCKFKNIIYITKQHYENCINYININKQPKFNRDNGSDISILHLWSIHERTEEYSLSFFPSICNRLSTKHKYFFLDRHR